MEHLVALLESESCANLLLALAHTLWQGALVAGILFLYLRRTPAEAANKRYVASVAAFGAIVLGALLTWSVLSYEPATLQQGTGGDVVMTPAAAATRAPATPEPAASPNQASTPNAEGLPRMLGLRQVWIVEAWLAGVVLMFCRLVAVLIGGGRLLRQCQPMEDQKTLELVERLRDRMGIRRRVRVLVGDRISAPGVIGCFWPTLLLPISMVSGVPTEDLQAILVHELAHIRRYDYLVNFLQMVVEALLFFNPAVWWINRQVRLEREACCDAAGVLWTGQRTKYAEVLVAWAHRIGEGRYGTPAPAVGFAGDADSGNMLDRVRRILIAGHQPRPRVPWHIATAMVVLTLACLVAIQQATGLAVELAGRILTPRERIDRITAISREYGFDNREYGPEDKIEVSGMVRTWDSAPLPGRTKLVVECVGRRFNGSIAIAVSKDGSFRTSVDYGRLYIMASAEGYASVFAGPFDAEPGGRVEGVELVLEQGFPGRIQVVDESGRPIPGAELVGGYTYPNSGSHHYTIKLATDANGLATLDHAAAGKITFQVNASGFEAQQAENLILKPDEIGIVALKRTQPATGVVLSETTGQPVARAEIRILTSVQGSHSYGEDRTKANPDAVTDAEGRFELNRLRQDRKYLLFVQASGYGYQYVPDVEAANRDIKVVLGPKKVIRGTITGDLSLLATDTKSGHPIIHVKNSYQYPHFSGYTDGNGKSPVTIRAGVGHFEIDDFWGQTVTLSAGIERGRLNVQEDRLDDIVIDLSPGARRQVVLRFQTPEGAPPIEGSVRIDYITDRARQQKQGLTPEWLEIQDGQASCEIPVPAQFKYNIDFYQGKRPVGYWFNEIFPINIAPGEAPFVIDVPVFAAGAIYGRILRPDGRPAQDARASLMIAKKPAIADQQGRFLLDLNNALSNGVDRGTFNATPLPLGGRYAIVAHEDNVFAMSEAFSLDEKTPIVNVDLALPRGIDLEGRLLDADGTGARNEVALHVSVKRGEHSWGTSGAQIQPDETGRFIFKNVNPGPAGTCSVRVIGRTGYRPAQQEITNLHAPVVIRLERGVSVTGAVIDNVTGRPVPGAEVYAFAVDDPGGQISRNWEILETDGRTNAQGRFIFTNMAARKYSLNVRSANLADPSQPPIVTGGQRDPVVLRIRIPEWSDLKPRKL